MNSDRATLTTQRTRLEQEGFLSLTAPGDALAAYYALYHDPSRSQLLLQRSEAGQINGFVAVCQTGFNLFQPTVALRASTDGVAVGLLRQALQPGRPYYIVTTPTLGPAVQAAVHLERVETNRVYRFNLRRFRPETNVLVQPARSADGSPRFVIRSQDQIAAEAGVNWRSPNFAELYVHTQPQSRGRGWGKAVVVACATLLIHSGVQPLYMATEGDEASVRLAESAGFVDSGAREFAGAGVYQ